eukprot:CAMPEP_0168345444 /NCGR_PEP_ID=MMETSP0213-20121227/17563_1 /TAXON_ID=151035 /ORGANISM="Euplotes harpa, Strain FSP1.4" /LENGTH=110 /DNA_ID=CAMNT_0008353673 /DNA_START=639 /DNA_END=971 /DNA_ORIENTATION=+
MSIDENSEDCSPKEEFTPKVQVPRYSGMNIRLDMGSCRRREASPKSADILSEPYLFMTNSNSQAKTSHSRKTRIPVKKLTSHVVTRWYRSPELILMEKDYDYGIDVWAIG